MSERRVLHCIGTLAGGGAERQLCYLAEGLIDKGWSIHVATIRRGVNVDRLQRCGTVIHDIRVTNYHDPRIIWMVRDTIEQIAPCAVQCWQRPMDVYGGLAAILTRRPFISMERTSPSRFGGSLKGILKVAVAQLSAANVSNSLEGQAYWRKRLFRRIPNVLLPNIVPFEELAAVPSVERRSHCAVAVGRLAPEKNYEVLLAAAKQLTARLPGFQLRIFGEGSERRRIERFIYETGLEGTVLMHGYTDDVWSWIKSSTVFVSISQYEGMPNAVLEAAALRSPMLLSDIPAHRAHFDDSSATFVDPENANAIAETLFEMFATPEAQRRKTDRAYMAVASFGRSQVSARYAELYRTICTDK
jgi:glycosyltransferase involved in cell wall biosynthesis